MYIVGLTGGIGSGKTTVAKLFKAHKVTVVNLDDISREVVAVGEPALATIAEHFGDVILNPDQSLNRQKLRAIIFDKPSEKDWLETLLHPIIQENALQQLQQAREQHEASYRILESPLLLETANAKHAHHALIRRVLLVDCPVETQVERSLKRDNTSRESILSIINSQLPREEKRALADDIIDNEGNIEALEEQVNRLHNDYSQHS